VTINPSDRCLALYSQEEWQAFCLRLDGLQRSKDKRQFERLLSDLTVEGVACDAQGRLLLSPSQREFAKIDREVVTVGAFKRVEIWSKDRYEANVASVEAAAAFSEEQGLF
jgi:MraZ protein